MSVFRVCFLGTPPFAAQHLQALLSQSEYEVVGVVTQPDRPAGRKMQLTASAVKILALEKNLKVISPENLRKEPEAFAEIKSWKADVAVVVAFGQILSQEFLDSFKFGAVNVHGSLLPKWRGAAPIQRALEAGDAESGVSLQRMVKKLDAGPIIAETKVFLDSAINATELYGLLAVKGCDLLQRDLLKYLKNEIEPKEQDETKVTLASKILKEESLLDWNLSAEILHNRVRAFSMGPGTFVNFQGKRLKIHKTQVATGNSKLDAGSVSGIDPLLVQTGSNRLQLLEVQPESKSKMQAAEFVKSVKLTEGEKFV